MLAFRTTTVLGFLALTLCLLFAACTAEASTPEDSPVTQEQVQTLVQVITKLHDRVSLLEAQKRQLESHTHQNDHSHWSTDDFLDPGFHEHFNYAEKDHTHWGYADEFHTHEDYGY